MYISLRWGGGSCHGDMSTKASPPTGHVGHLALTSLQFCFGNSGNMTLLHIHQYTTDGNMRLVSQKLKH